mmetsp:Transcript_40813/g.117216  ORF Transcript_40813/g.117216 Transcript_40813/m.117216 type:complete len:879 (-) Transcript_40813:66-2702(-)
MEGSDLEPLEAARAAPNAEPATWGAASSSAGESPRGRLQHVSEVLEAIFEYYSVQQHAPRLTCTRFQRMAMDSCLIGGKLPSAKVDITFAQVCGNCPHMTLSQFRDAIVRLAQLKFPELSAADAVLRVYTENLSAFEGSAELSGAFESLTPDTLQVLAGARPGLQVLYEGYFPGEVCKHAAGRSTAAALRDAKASFLQVLGDFEVVPDLVSKAVAHSIFRDVAKTRVVPESFWGSLLEGGGGAAHRCPIGHVFTFAHLAAGIALAAMRCFVHEDGGAVRKLLEWMDSSKGRVLFASSCPGVLGSGAILRLMPERSPAAGGAPSRRGTSPVSAGWAAVADTPPRRGGPSPTSSCGGALAHAHSGSFDGDVPEFIGGSSPSATPVRRLSRGSVVSGGGGSASLARQRSATLRDANAAAVQGLSDSHRKIAQQVFMYYVALGDPLNRTTMSSMKFSRFLRDAGLLSSEVSVAPGAFAFDPQQRRRGTVGAASEPMHRRSSSAGAMTSARRYSVSSARPSSRSGVDKGEALRMVSGLPLRVFLQPPLTSVDADLVFVQALRSQEGTPQSARMRPAMSEVHRFGMAKAGAKPKGRFLDFDGFCRALADVAAKCMALAQEGTPAECSPSVGAEALEHFCDDLLVPLANALGAPQSEDLRQAVQAMDDRATSELLGRNDRSLGNIFQLYSTEGGGHGRFWTMESLSRFAEDFGFASELSNLPLQKMLKDCILYQSGEDPAFVAAAANTGSQLTFRGFRLLLVMISQKLSIAQMYQRPMDRLALLFTGMNSMFTTASLGGGRFAAQQDVLLHVPRPARSASAPRLEATVRRSSASVASASPIGVARLRPDTGGSGGSGRRGVAGGAAGKRTSVEGSWAALMAAEQA